jgi:signal transduction histidine kinase
MKMTPKFSIKLKFLGVLSIILLGCIASYLSIALHTFKRDKTELVFDLNRSLVSGLNNEIENSLRSIKDKLEIYALTSESGGQRTRMLITDLLKNDPNVVYVSATNRLVTKKKQEYIRDEFLETYNLKPRFFSEELRSSHPVPIDEILRNGSAIWSINVEGVPTLIGVGKAVITEAADKTPISQYAVVAYIKANQLLKSVAHLHANSIFLTNGKGQLLLHSQKDTKSGGSFTEMPIVQTAITSPLSTQVSTFDYDNKTWMGAFSKTQNNEVIIFATIEEAKAFAAITSFVKRSILFASIIATVAFIAAVLFSQTLTRPIQILVDGMNKVTAGELETRIVVKTSDETSLLASSFNKMIKELQDSRHQLEEINRDLETKVKERTAQLEDRNRAVKEAQEALIRTTRLASVGEIAARAAHEVLNPLTGIMTRLNIVQKRSEKEPEAEIKLLEDILNAWKTDYEKGGFQKLVQTWQQPSQIQAAMNLFDEDMENLLSVAKTFHERNQKVLEDATFLQNEAQRISKIVQNMRSLSRVSGQKEKYSLHQLLQESVNIMGDLFYQKNIQVCLQLGLEKDDVLVDRDEFIQVLTNLYRNSIQAIEQRPGEHERMIEILTCKENDKYCVDIRDSGNGILPEHQNHLFEAQFSTKSKDEGTGLGLNISRRFIRAVGGDLFLLRSTPNHETVFRLTLPIQLKAQRGAAA